jgi:serine/threonine protein kinase
MKTIIGHYAILSELGRGGMGVVYKAFEPKLDRYVAIKELSSSLSHDAALVQRFVREAQAMAALNDPHIIQIHYIGQDDEQPYFAMEFIDGESIDSLLKREGKLSVADSLKLLQQAAIGLSAAHEQGVIHRDIKPSNLMLNKRDQLKIADFGIAHTQRDSSKKLTATGDVVGTPGYLSPEVCLGNPVDARSDLFALGIVLFEMLSGRLPFEDASPLKLMLSVVESEIPDIRGLNEQVDADTVRILNRLLAKNPDARYQNAKALLDDLHQHAALQTKTGLSVHAVLPAGGASTVLSTPGLQKANAISKPTLATPAGNAPVSAAAANDAFVIKKQYVWAALAAFAASIVGGFLWFKPNTQTSANNPLPAVEAPASHENTIASETEETKTPAVPVVTTNVAAPAPVPVIEKPIEPAKIETVKPEKTIAQTNKPETNKAVEPAVKAKPVVTEAVDKYGSVYTGPQNEQLSIVQATGKALAYIKVTGINSSYDGKVIRAEVKPAPREGRDYYFEPNGRGYVMVVMRKDYSNGEMMVEVYIPGLDRIGRFNYNAELSKQLDSAQLRAEYSE